MSEPILRPARQREKACPNLTIKQITLDEQGDDPRQGRRRLQLGVLLIAGVLAVAEEVRYGHVLGTSDLSCEFVGGRRDHVVNRCMTPLCYWFDECKRPAYPGYWRERVRPGDSIAKVVFWLGEPGSIEGDTYYWAYGKADPENRLFSTTFQNGRFVEWRDNIILTPKPKTN